MPEFPLAQWFDLTKPISRDDCDLVAAEMMLRHYKDCGNAPCEHRCHHPDCKETRRVISDLYAAVKQHNKLLHAERMLKFQTEVELLSRGSTHLSGKCSIEPREN